MSKYSADLVETVACIVHEMNRRWCELIGDNSLRPWDDLPDADAESLLVGVRAALEGNPKTPEQSHEAWMQYKAAQGWVYGDKKDPVERTHPCMVPYSDLPPQQKAKDAFFLAIVEAFR